MTVCFNDPLFIFEKEFDCCLTNLFDHASIVFSTIATEIDIAVETLDTKVSKVIP